MEGIPIAASKRPRGKPVKLAVVYSLFDYLERPRKMRRSYI